MTKKMIQIIIRLKIINKPKQKNYGLNDFFGLNKKNKNLTRVKGKGLGLSLGLSDNEEKKNT